MTYLLARSKAGHDKDKIYFVVREEEDFFFLADGKTRTFDRPKKKNKKHVQMIKDLPENVKEALEDKGAQADIRIKRAIKLYLSREVSLCQNQM